MKRLADWFANHGAFVVNGVMIVYLAFVIGTIVYFERKYSRKLGGDTKSCTCLCDR